MKSLELNKPHLLIVVGLPGAGKSFFAKQFGETFGAPYVDYGRYHELTGSQHVGDVVATDMLGQLFLTKQTIVIEGRGETKQDRLILAKVAATKGYKPLFIWVQTEPQTTIKRVVNAPGAPYTRDEYDMRVEAFVPLERAEPQIVISGKHTFASQAKMVLKRLVTPRTTLATPTAPARPIRPLRSGRIIVN